MTTRTQNDVSGVRLFPVTIILFLVLAAAQFIIVPRFDFPLLAGDRSDAILDLWSLQHFCTGVILGTIILRSKFSRFNNWRDLAVIIFLFALCWEVTELAMESGLFGQAIETWKRGFEHWSNRLISDIFLIVSGALVAKRFPQSWKIMLLPAAIWLLLNVTSPNSMYIQGLLF